MNTKDTKSSPVMSAPYGEKIAEREMREQEAAVKRAEFPQLAGLEAGD